MVQEEEGRKGNGEYYKNYHKERSSRKRGAIQGDGKEEKTESTTMIINFGNCVIERYVIMNVV